MAEPAPRTYGPAAVLDIAVLLFFDGSLAGLMHLQWLAGRV
jgi:hypothetical protein